MRWFRTLGSIGLAYGGYKAFQTWRRSRAMSRIGV
jgi:hypothetical protein